MTVRYWLVFDRDDGEFRGRAACIQVCARVPMGGASLELHLLQGR